MPEITLTKKKIEKQFKFFIFGNPDALNTGNSKEIEGMYLITEKGHITDMRNRYCCFKEKWKIYSY